MALQTRIRLLSLTRLFVLALFIMIAAVAANVAYAGEPAQMSQTGAMWQVIMTLFGVLNTILTGVIVWLVSNQKELFQRMGKCIFE